MDKTKHSIDLSRDLLQYAKDEISIKKRKEIQKMLSEDSKLREFYYNFFTQENIESELNKHSQINIEKRWQHQLRKIDKLSRVKRLVVNFMRVSAAMIIIAFAIHFYFDKHDETVEIASIKPGSSKAVLVLSDGTQKVLNEIKNKQINEDSTVIQNTGEKIVYKKSGRKVTETTKYNKLVIPRGGEYKLLLSDGTTVWLNSQSTITYPVSFSSNKRLVKLEGEAFFDVAKNPDSPFIVESKNNEIEVIGTRFNVRSYNDEDTFSTTLNEGRVRITNGKSAVLLMPNQQVSKSDSAIKYDIRKVDASVHSAWVTGKYIFKNESLEILFSRLSRWYDYNVEFKSESVRNMKFYGTIDKKEGIEKILKLLNKTRKINYKVEDKKIIISNYNQKSL